MDLQLTSRLHPRAGTHTCMRVRMGAYMVYMHVCMHMRMHVCMHVCAFICARGCAGTCPHHHPINTHTACRGSPSSARHHPLPPNPPTIAILAHAHTPRRILSFKVCRERHVSSPTYAVNLGTRSRSRSSSSRSAVVVVVVVVGIVVVAVVVVVS